MIDVVVDWLLVIAPGFGNIEYTLSNADAANGFLHFYRSDVFDIWCRFNDLACSSVEQIVDQCFLDFHAIFITLKLGQEFYISGADSFLVRRPQFTFANGLAGTL
jgi:hypothetical protein